MSGWKVKKLSALNVSKNKDNSALVRLNIFININSFYFDKTNTRDISISLNDEIMINHI